MNFNTKTITITIIWSLLFLAVTPVQANLIANTQTTDLGFIQQLIAYRYLFFIWIVILFILFLINFLIEFTVIYALLKKHITNRIHLLRSIFIVNAITFLPTQLISYTLEWYIRTSANSFEEFIEFRPEIYLPEVIPFIAEYYLLKWQFNILYKNKDIKQKVSPKKIILITLLANLASFLISFLLN